MCIRDRAKVVKELVVEGPVSLDGDGSGQQVFLFLQPFMEEDAYLGEVIVALDRDYVLEQLGLNYLSEQGYDYELWRGCLLYKSYAAAQKKRGDFCGDLYL